MRLLTCIIGMVAAGAAILFAISNRGTVSVSMWPFPLALDLSLYVLVFTSVALGFFVGALTSWVAAGKHRRRARRQQSELRAMESDLEDLRIRLDPPSEGALGSNMEEVP